MTRWLLIIALSFGLGLGPASVFADEQAETSTPANKRYEEVEILRRLLSQKIQALYPANSWKTAQLAGYSLETCTSCHAANPWHASDSFTTSGKPDQQVLVDLGCPVQMNNTGTRYRSLLNTLLTDPAHHRWYQKVIAAAPEIEGSYLKGHGIVYTLTLPPPNFPAPAKAATPAPSPVSEWERVRQQVRGEKPEAKSPPPEPKRPSLSETVLRVLAENGQHLKQLGDNENITIAITFREPRTDGPHAFSTIGNYYAFAEAACVLDPARASNHAAQVNTALETDLNALTSKAAKDPTSVRDHELLGNLSLKQERYEEALSAFQKAVSLLPAEEKSETSGQLLMKLARAYLGRGNAEAASKTLGEYLVLQKKPAATKPAAAKPAAAAPLPDKLIVTVPKRLLDQSGSGKLSFEDFRKGASVEIVRFPAGSK